jgi:hypothetical protein
MLDLAEIAARSGMPPRKLRYVLDHDLLPSDRTWSRGRGSARLFTPPEAFVIALAARMLDAGLKRATVRESLASLCRVPFPGRPETGPMMLEGFLDNGLDSVEVGDWWRVRLRGVAGRKPWATQWLPFPGGHDLADAALEEALLEEPSMTVTLNVGPLRRALGLGP